MDLNICEQLTFSRLSSEEEVTGEFHTIIIFIRQSLAHSQDTTKQGYTALKIDSSLNT